MSRCYIVPGFLSSALWRGGPGQSAYWADLSALILRGVDPLRLDAAGTGPGSPGGETLYPFGAVSLYWDRPARQLEAQLRPEGYSVFVWGWDWRLRIIPAGSTLGAHILAEVDPDEPCVLACHSAGGLLARAAWAWLDARGKAGLVRRIVTLGTPHWGSYSPVSLWVGTGDLIRQLRWILNGLAFGANSIPMSGGRRYWSDDELIALTQTWPGLYDLLPVLGAPGADADPDRPALYDADSYSASRRPSQAHLTYARDVMGPWLRSAASQPPPWVMTSVVGNGYTTVDRLVSADAPLTAASLAASASGDGTVAELAAAAAGSVVYDWNAGHADMPNASVTGGYLAAWLLAERSPPSPAPPPVEIPGIVPVWTTMPPLVSTVAGCPVGASRADGSCHC